MKTDAPTTTRIGRLKMDARIVLAIAWKDIVEALKNKNTLAVLLTAIPMVFLYYYLPILGGRDDAPRIYVYNAGGSVLVSRLENSDVLDLRTYPSEARMLEALRNSEIPELGLSIPAAFDQALEAGEDTQLQGFALNWVDPADVEEARQLLEDEIAFQLGRQVPVVVQDRVYLQPDSHGLGTSAGIAWVFVLTMIGLTLIPHLILEEKQSRTMEVLMISPAGPGRFVAGKALAGLFYSLLGASVAMMVFRSVVVHWWLAAATTILGALFAISIGLLLGTIIESRAQLTMWAWVFILPMLLPIFLSLLEGLVPDGVISVMRLLPGVVVMNLLRFSFAGTAPLAPVLLGLAWLATWLGGGMAIVIRLVRRQDRLPESPAGAQGKKRSGTTPFARESWLKSRAAHLLRPKSATHAEADQMDAARLRARELNPVQPRPWHILWAIAAKDIGATLKNKLALSIMLGSAFVVASNAVPRLLLQSRVTPGVVVYDKGRSTILRTLGASDDIRLGIVDSEKEMREMVTESQDTLVGIVVPEDFDRMAGRSDLIELEGYAAHWAEEDRVNRNAALVEDQLSTGTWGLVHIRVADQKLYPSAELRGQTLMFVLLFTVVMLTMGLALAPLLIVEERQAHTLDVLLVSPARIEEVIGGKAVAGAFYCILAALVVFVLNRVLVVHWGVALLATCLLAAFAVTLGLLVGILSENPTTVSMWGTMLLLIFFGLTFLNALPGMSWPPVLEILLGYLPTVAFARMMGIALAGDVVPAHVWANAAALVAAVAVALGLLRWRLRLTDR